MQCHDCHGLGKNAEGGVCWFCNGSGATCDVCGEACDESGVDICNHCRAETKDEED